MTHSRHPQSHPIAQVLKGRPALRGEKNETYSLQSFQTVNWCGFVPHDWLISSIHTEGEYSGHVSLPQKCLLTIGTALHWRHHTAPQVNRSQGIFTLEEKEAAESPKYTMWTCLTLLLQTVHRLSQTHVRWKHRVGDRKSFPKCLPHPPYKLREKMQAGLELRSGWKKWRVGDAQVATSHWRTACSRPWRSMCSRELVTGHHVCAEQSLNPNSWHKLLFSFELDLLVEEKASSSVTSQNCWT